MNQEISDIRSYLKRVFSQTLLDRHPQLVFLRGKKEFLSRITRELVEVALNWESEPVVHTFRLVGQYQSPFFPLLALVKTRFQILDPEEKEKFFHKAQIYYTLRPVFWSYLNDQKLERKEDLILDELEFEQNKVLQGVLSLIKLTFTHEPAILVIENAHLLPLSTLRLLESLFRSKKSSLPLVLVLQSWKLFTPGLTNHSSNWEQAIGSLLSMAGMIDFGATGESDSLEYQEPKYELDSLKILEECYHFLTLEEGSEYLGEFISKLIQKQNASSDGRYLLMAGDFYFLQGNYDTALIYLQSLVHKKITKSNQRILVDIYRRMGQVYLRKNDVPLAYKYSLQGMKIANDLDDLVLEYQSLAAFMSIEEREGTMEISQWKANIYRLIDITRTLGWKNNSLFWMIPNDRFNPISEREEGQKLLDESLALAKELGNDLRLAAAYHIQGLYHIIADEYDLVEDYYKKSEKLKKKIGNQLEIAKVQNGIGYFYFQKSDFKNAEAYFGKSFHSSFRSRDFHELCMGLCNLGINALFGLNFPLAVTRFQNLLNIMLVVGIEELPYHSRFGIYTMIALSNYLGGDTSGFMESYLALESTLGRSSRRNRIQTYTEEEFLFFLATAIYEYHNNRAEKMDHWIGQGNVYLQDNFPIIKYFKPFFHIIASYLYHLTGRKKHSDIHLKEAKESSVARRNEIYQKFLETGLSGLGGKIKLFRTTQVPFSAAMEAAYTNNVLHRLHRKVSELDFLNSFQGILSITDTPVELLKKTCEIIHANFPADYVGIFLLEGGRIHEKVEMDPDATRGNKGMDKKVLEVLVENGEDFSENLPPEFGFVGIPGEESLVSFPMRSPITSWVLLLVGYSSGRLNRLSRSDFDILSMASRQLFGTLEKMEQELEIKKINQKLKEMNEALYEKATTDGLTGLYNRLFFLQKLREVTKKNFEDEHRNSFTVMYLDLDYFKHYNDNYGHDTGDRVLLRLSQLLREVTRDTDFPTRWGGDEFVLLLPHTPLMGAVRVAQRILEAFRDDGEMADPESFLEEDMRVKPDVPPLSCSIGIAVFDGQKDSEIIIRQADESMYQAKNDGKNRYRIFPDHKKYL